MMCFLTLIIIGGLKKNKEICIGDFHHGNFPITENFLNKKQKIKDK